MENELRKFNEDITIVSINKDFIELKKNVESLKVDSAETQQKGMDLLTAITKSGKTLELKRVEIVSPWNDKVKIINNGAKVLSVPLKQLDVSLRGKLRDYQIEQERIQREAELKARQEAEKKEREKAEKEAEIQRKIKEAEESENKAEKERLQRRLEKEQEKEILPEPPVDIAPSNVKSSGSTMSFPDVWKFTIEDKSKIPDEYIIVDEKKIGKVVKSGVRNIPGVKIYSEKGTSFRA